MEDSPGQSTRITAECPAINKWEISTTLPKARCSLWEKMGCERCVCTCACMCLHACKNVHECVKARESNTVETEGWLRSTPRLLKIPNSEQLWLPAQDWVINTQSPTGEAHSAHISLTIYTINGCGKTDHFLQWFNHWSSVHAPVNNLNDT